MRRVFALFLLGIVDHHVSAVLARLDVSAREEAAALARQHLNL
jgi:DNA-binding CsgD family transcriptional regulator